MFSSRPLFSIVTPSLNQGAYIERTIGSVLRQDYPNIQYIVADGGSTDQTTTILERYGHRLCWRSQPDAGQAAAVQKAIASCRGEFAGWLNSDDLYAPGALSAAAEFLCAHPDVGMVYGDAVFIDGAGRRIAPCAHVEDFDPQRLRDVSDFIVQPAAFFRRSAYEAVGGIDPNLHWSMDYDLWLKIAARFPVARIHRVLAGYRWLGSNKTGTGDRRRLEEIELVARRHGADGLPAYFAIERAALDVRDALAALRRREWSGAGLCMRSACGTLSGPRILRQLLLRQTWRTMAARARLRRFQVT